MTTSSQTQSFFRFGDTHPDYPVPVLNERAVRASAGILFFFGLVCFMNAWLVGSFEPTRVFVVAFLVDFTIRIFINPSYAPTLIVGQWFVRRQRPDFVGAPQKRFAWSIGFVLALTMLYLMVLNHMVGPANLLVCSACLTLMFFEAAFGICLGCKVYNMFNKGKAQLCPGGACDMSPQAWPPVKLTQVLVVAAFIALVVGVAQRVQRADAVLSATTVPVSTTSSTSVTLDLAEAERCKVPDFAKAMGHESQWKLHNNCK
jgi:hypothetical protein